jgi:hypothetical protein
MVRPRAPYIAASCDRQYRRPGGNYACVPVSPEGTGATGAAASGLPGLGQFDFDPQFDLGQHPVEAGVTGGGFEIGRSVA